MTIRKILVHGRVRWRVDHGLGKHRIRAVFPTRIAAELHAESLRLQLRQSGEWLASLPAHERAEMLAVAVEVHRAGLTLREVWQGYQGAAAPPPDKPLGDVIEELVHAKREAGRRPKYIKTLAPMLRLFARGRENQPIASLQVADIEAWLSGKSAQTRATYGGRLATLFAWAQRRGYITDNPCRRLERPMLEQKPPSVLSVEQCTVLMGFVRERHPRALGWFALALFAGVRPEEADRLTWEAIDVEAGTVSVDAAASKLRRRRIVHVQPAAIAWLKLAQKSGADLPLPRSSRRRVVRAARDYLKLPRWPQDVLRHTCATHWLNLWQDAGKVAHELGNSAVILLRHYRELIPRSESEKFWGLLP